MLLAFAVLLSISGRDALRNLAFKNPMFSSLKLLFEVTVEEETAKTVLLKDEVLTDKRKLKTQRPVDDLVSKVWNFLVERPESKMDFEAIYVMTRYKRARQSLLVELAGPEAYNCYREYLEAEKSLFSLVRDIQKRSGAIFHCPEEDKFEEPREEW